MAISTRGTSVMGNKVLKKLPSRAIPKSATVRDVLVKCQRRCCICYFVKDDPSERRGQIAHLNHVRSDSSFENLVYLCLDCHDGYDSRTSQSKNYTAGEVKYYRDLLYSRLSIKISDHAGQENAKNSKPNAKLEKSSMPPLEVLSAKKLFKLIGKHRPIPLYKFINDQWKIHMPEPERPELFAFKSPNRFDGICRIQWIKVHGVGTVVLCEEIEGNPGVSITNAIEYIAWQICKQLKIKHWELKLIEHHDVPFIKNAPWHLVEFGSFTRTCGFQKPRWHRMQAIDWERLYIRLRYNNKTRRRDRCAFIRIPQSRFIPPPVEIPPV